VDKGGTGDVAAKWCLQRGENVSSSKQAGRHKDTALSGKRLKKTKTGEEEKRDKKHGVVVAEHGGSKGSR